jgi:hypothetical protein
MMALTTNVLSANDTSFLSLHFTPIAGRHHDISGVKGVGGFSFRPKPNIRILKRPADIMSVRSVLNYKNLLPARSFKTT